MIEKKEDINNPQTPEEKAKHKPSIMEKDDDFARAIMGDDFKEHSKENKENQKDKDNENKTEEDGKDEKIKAKTKKDQHSGTLEEAIVNSTEDEAPLSTTFTLRKILGGDILTAQFVRRQIWLILVIVLFLFVYISNRYSVQKDLIEIDRLQNELQNAKYKALSATSLLTEKSRESHILEILKTNKDSILKQSSKPPFIINVPEE